MKILLEKGTGKAKTSILIEFANIDSDTAIGDNAISYSIVGDDRDWVFITSSQLEERLSRIKKFAPNQLSQNRQSLLLLQLFITLLFVIGTFIAAHNSIKIQKLQMLEEISSVERRWKNGDIIDPVEVSFEIAKIQANFTQSAQSLDWETNKWFVYFIVGLLILMGIGLFWSSYFPFYTFVWGDYVKVYERKKSVGKFIVVGVIFSIIISVVGNYVSVILGIGK